MQFQVRRRVFLFAGCLRKAVEAKPTPRNRVFQPDALFIGPPAGVAAAQFDMIVHKFGRTTDYTVGRVIDLTANVSVAYNIGTLVFTNQILIRGLSEQSFSEPGDSGSLILQRSTNQAVGLLFAGSPSHTIANHIQGVLDALNVQLA